MRRLWPSSGRAACVAESRRAIAVPVPWASKLPPPSDPRWAALGTAIVQSTLDLDSGKEAFDECLQVRKQLECIVREAGFPNMSVAIFGGMVTNRLLETGGDVDFVAVSDVEPTFEQASETVAKLGREMRRVGIRANSVPRARVPVVTVDRVSTALPGTPLHSMSTTAVFQLNRPATPSEQTSFDSAVRSHYGATLVEWNQAQQLATVKFPNTEAAVNAIAGMRKVGDIEIPLRLPIDPKFGPELYRFPFDLCLQSSGLQNSHLIGNALAQWTYARHLLLMMKRWGRSSGVVDSFNGMLASYAVTILVVHFLVRCGKFAPLDINAAPEPQFLPQAPVYQPLQGLTAGDVAELGYLSAAMLEYYASCFDYDKDVAATTTRLLAKETLRWGTKPKLPGAVGKPPYYHLALKDPYNTDNIGRNLDSTAAQYVKTAFQLADAKLTAELNDPKFAVELLMTSAPRPADHASSSPGAVSGDEDTARQETRRQLKKLEFSSRKKAIHRLGEATAKRNTQAKAAQDLTRSIVHWIRGGSRPAHQSAESP